MRAVFALVLFAACTPDIVSGSYHCGPNGSCPDDQGCSGSNNTCVLASTVQPFSCTPDQNTEPDDSAATAHALPSFQCVSTPFVAGNCMLQGDSEDWVKFDAPSTCASLAVQARITFTIAFEPLSIELWNLDTNTQLGVDTECPNSGENGEDLRCLDKTLMPGGHYGIKVRPTGENDCGGNCAYNRYTLRVQLGGAG